jgi:hypothetical protein
MKLRRTARSIVLAGLSLFILAGPMAFQHACQMADCCCQPEAAEGISFERTPCCGCGIFEIAQTPIQPATIQADSVINHVRAEAPVASTIEIRITRGDDLSGRFVETRSLSPPFSISFLNTPLIC